MTTIARLEVIPTREEHMSNAVANAIEALDRFDVSYETTPTDTVIEADDPAEVFAAAEAAHRAVADQRVITSLEVDEHRGRQQDRRDRVASVERALGRPPERERRGAGMESSHQGMPTAGSREGGTAETELRRYHGPVASDQPRRSQSSGAPLAETWQTGTRQTATRSTGRGEESRYLQSR